MREIKISMVYEAFFCHFKLIGILLIAIALNACSPNQDLKNEIVVYGSNVIARIKTCGNTSHKGYHTTLKGAAWFENRLIVNVEEGYLCGGATFANPEYSVTGNRLQLSWNWKHGEALTACVCDHDVRFEISNLPFGDYKIELQRRE